MLQGFYFYLITLRHYVLKRKMTLRHETLCAVSSVTFNKVAG